MKCSVKYCASESGLAALAKSPPPGHYSAPVLLES